MESGDDPYKLLGISTTATNSEIRSAYRRLALQNHPDKQQTLEEKERVTPLFVKISNAYELLSDPEQRAKYDQEQQQQQQHDDTNNNTSARRTSSVNHFTFHDPFQIFEEIFQSHIQGSMFPSTMFGGNLFGGISRNTMGMNFGMNTMGIGGDLFMNHLNGHGDGGLFPATAASSSLSPFGSFISPFAGMNLPTTATNSGTTTSSSFMSFSSSSNGNQYRMNGGSSSSSTTNPHHHQSVSVSTTTHIVNGRVETRTERIVRHADGTIERFIETPEMLTQPNYHPQQQQQQQNNQNHNPSLLLPPSSSSSSRRRHGGNTKNQHRNRRLVPLEGNISTTPEVASHSTAIPSSSSSSSVVEVNPSKKRKTAVKERKVSSSIDENNNNKKPSKKSKTNSSKEGDQDQPIVLD